MTIAFLGQKGLPAKSGGIERHVEFVATGLASRGHRVVVYGRRWYVGGAVAPVGIEQRITGGIFTKHLDAITHGLSALWDARRLQPDVIHLQGPSIGLIAPFARLLVPRAKLVITFHCLDREHAKWNAVARWMLKLGEWMTCRFAHRTLTVSQTLARYCLKEYRCQVQYLTHPFPLEKEPPATFWLAQNGLAHDRYFLFVARLIAHKNAHVLVEAYRRACVKQPSLAKDLPLAIVGGGAWTDAYVAELKRQASQVPGVVMLGEKTGEELRAIQSYAMAHVFPTASEGLAFSMIEAGACGRPVIMTDLPQNREALGEGTIEVPVGDVDALADALLRLANASPAERFAIGASVRRHVQAVFDYGSRVADIEQVYAELQQKPMEAFARA
jgi:glycosyltransferase involved in cell wall biosynthesis